MTKRNSYTKEFKLEAIRLLESGEKPGADIARELGFCRNMLYKWQQQLSVKADEAFKGAGRKSSKILIHSDPFILHQYITKLEASPMTMTLDQFKNAFPANPNTRFEYPAIEEVSTMTELEKDQAFDFLISRVNYQAGKETVSLLYELNRKRAHDELSNLMKTNKLSDAARVQIAYETSKSSANWSELYSLINSYASLNKEARNLYWNLLPDSSVTKELETKLKLAIEKESEMIPKIQGAQKYLTILKVPEGSTEYMKIYKQLRN